MSRFQKREDDERPMTYEEFVEMRERLKREVRELHPFTLESLRRLPPKSPCFNRKVSQRELQYLAILESTVDDLFG